MAWIFVQVILPCRSTVSPLYISRASKQTSRTRFTGSSLSVDDMGDHELCSLTLASLQNVSRGNSWPKIIVDGVSYLLYVIS